MEPPPAELTGMQKQLAAFRSLQTEHSKTKQDAAIEQENFMRVMAERFARLGSSPPLLDSTVSTSGAASSSGSHTTEAAHGGTARARSVSRRSKIPLRTIEQQAEDSRRRVKLMSNLGVAAAFKLTEKFTTGGYERPSRTDEPRQLAPPTVFAAATFDFVDAHADDMTADELHMAVQRIAIENDPTALPVVEDSIPDVVEIPSGSHTTEAVFLDCEVVSLVSSCSGSDVGEVVGFTAEAEDTL
jgi:hypothetical protein